MTRTLITSLLAAAAVACAGAGPAHAAGSGATDYYFDTGATMTIVDHEDWSANEVQTFNLSGVYIGRIAGDTKKSFTINRCAGGEVRVELIVEIDRDSAYTSMLRTYARLYEGNSCSTTDIESALTMPQYAIHPGWPPLEYPIHLFNEDEGGDYANMKLRFKSANVT